MAYVNIASTTVGSGGASTVTFSSIPQIYSQDYQLSYLSFESVEQCLIHSTSTPDYLLLEQIGRAHV